MSAPMLVFPDHRATWKTAHVHMNGRVYDPGLGRFLSVDSVFQFPENTQSLNPYSYVLNSPLTLTDPTGLVSEANPFMWGEYLQSQGGLRPEQRGGLQAELNALKSWAGVGDFGDVSNIGSVSSRKSTPKKGGGGSGKKSSGGTDEKKDEGIKLVAVQWDEDKREYVASEVEEIPEGAEALFVHGRGQDRRTAIDHGAAQVNGDSDEHRNFVLAEHPEEFILKDLAQIVARNLGMKTAGGGALADALQSASNRGISLDVYAYSEGASIVGDAARQLGDRGVTNLSSVRSVRTVGGVENHNTMAERLAKVGVTDYKWRANPGDMASCAGMNGHCANPLVLAHKLLLIPTMFFNGGVHDYR